jgi:predicted TIM-barrel fold metal-dependent hydrolase
MLVDHHAHWLPEALLERFSRRQEPPMSWYAGGHWFFRAGVLARQLPVETFDLDRRSAHLRTLGIDRQILSWSPLWNLEALPPDEAQAAAAQFNDATVAQVRANGTFRGLALVPIDPRVQATAELRRVHGLGLEGFVLPAWAVAGRVEADRTAPLFEAAQDLGMRVLVHPGQLPPARTAGDLATTADRYRHFGLQPQHEIGQAMLTLCCTDWLEAFPRVAIQFANGGGSFVPTLERLRHMAIEDPAAVQTGFTHLHRQIFVDTASLGPVGIAATRELLGSKAVVFGTDMPIFSARSAVIDWRRASRIDRESPPATLQVDTANPLEREEVR